MSPQKGIDQSYRRAAGPFFAMVFLAVLLPPTCSWSDPREATAADPRFHFSIKVPAGWRHTVAADSPSFLRVSATSPDSNSALAIYALRASGWIDVKKFAAGQQFEHLGRVVNAAILRESVGARQYVEKQFAPNAEGYHGFARFEADSAYGYILVALDKSGDFTIHKRAIATFETHIPISARIPAGLDYLKGIVLVLLGIGALHLLGRLGQLVRKGVGMKRYMRKLEREAQESRRQINRAARDKYVRKANTFIGVPIVGLALTYAGLAIVAPLEVFLPSLAALLPVVLGYGGILIVPSSDAQDYVPPR